MRRLTLILSDLYLPDDPGPEELAALSEQAGLVAMPHLEWLLRFARHERIDDWRAQLAAQAGDAGFTRDGLARFAAAGRVPPDRLAGSWLATPVQLEARLDHVRLARRGLLRIALEERLAWCDEFARSFGPELVLHDAGARGFLLTGLEARGVMSIDPARVLGADIAASLPRDRPEGGQAAKLRRLSAEIEMWLHGAVLNREREKMQVARISSLWLWGGGHGADPGPLPRRDDCAYAGEDPWFAALARAQTGRDAQPAPARYTAIASDAPHRVVELAPVSDASLDLASLDAQWFGPARAALGSGALGALEILLNDTRFLVRRRSSWRFWRRAGHWMEQLRRCRPAAQA